MALDKAREGQAIDVRPLGAQLGEAQSIALFKSEQIQVLRLVLPAGHGMPPHRVEGEITIQCVEGHVVVDVAGSPSELPAGHLLFVRGGVEHALTARAAASVLVTIVLR